MKVLNEWYKATEEVTKVFLKKYFPEEVYGEDTYWVCDEVGTVLFVADYVFGLGWIIEALQMKVKPMHLFGYYWFVEECAHEEKPPGINFKNYVKEKVREENKNKLK